MSLIPTKKELTIHISLIATFSGLFAYWFGSHLHYQSEFNKELKKKTMQYSNLSIIDSQEHNRFFQDFLYNNKLKYNSSINNTIDVSKFYDSNGKHIEENDLVGIIKQYHP